MGSLLLAAWSARGHTAMDLALIALFASILAIVLVTAVAMLVRAWKADK